MAGNITPQEDTEVEGLDSQRNISKSSWALKDLGQALEFTQRREDATATRRIAQDERMEPRAFLAFV